MTWTFCSCTLTGSVIAVMGEDTETNTYREYLQTLGVNGEIHDILVANGFDSKEALSVLASVGCWKGH